MSKHTDNSENQIAIFANAGIGNFLMYLSAIKYLKQKRPDILIDCIVLKSNLTEIAKKSGLFLNTISKKKILINLFTLKSKQYSTIILSNHESFLSPFLIARLLRSKNYVGFKSIAHWSNKYHFALTNKITLDKVVKETEAYLNLFVCFGIKIQKGMKPFFPVNSQNNTIKSWWQTHLGNSYVVGIHIGNASRQPWKVLQNHKFKKIFIKIAKEFPDIKFIAFGEPSDKKTLKKIFFDVEKQNYFLKTNNSVFDVADMIKRCDLMVCNDGGLLHIAEAVGTKAISIFGPTDYHIFGPEFPSIIIRNDLPCSPCYSLPGDQDNPINCLDKKCLNEITVSAVFNTIKKEIINNEKRSHD